MVDLKTLEKAEQFHIKFQIDMYFSGFKKSNGVTYLWSDKIKDFYWNYATEINTTEPETLVMEMDLVRSSHSVGRNTWVFEWCTKYRYEMVSKLFIL